jgi:hypothetical protein
LPSYVVYGETVALSVSATKVNMANQARFGYRKDYISLVKNGYILFEAIPMSKDSTGQVVSP